MNEYLKQSSSSSSSEAKEFQLEECPTRFPDNSIKSPALRSSCLSFRGEAIAFSEYKHESGEEHASELPFKCDGAKIRSDNVLKCRITNSFRLMKYLVAQTALVLALQSCTTLAPRHRLAELQTVV